MNKLALAAAILTSTVAAQADWVQGHFRADGTYVAPYYRTPANGNPYDNLSYRTPAPRLVSPSLMPSSGSLRLTPRTLPNIGQSHGSSGYVYRNPYAAIPSVSVSGYSRATGTFVAPHVRTPANHTVTDNLSYRGFGTVKVPRN